MDDLDRLRAVYGFDRVLAIPALHAAEVSVDRAQLDALLVNAPSDSRIRYVAPVGPRRRLMSTPNDPLLQAINPTSSLPYEWQFGASHVDRALDLSQGSLTILVGTIDTGAADIPDLTGKVDGRWRITYDGALHLDSDTTGNDDVGHGTAVASLIAANVDDGFGMAGFGGAAHVVAVRDDFFNDLSIAMALVKLDSLGCRIINMSIGGTSPDSPILLDALHKAAVDGVLLVASAGNDAGGVNYPAADLQPQDGGQSFGLAVGASTVGGSLAAFSSSGKHLSLVAPGTYDDNCSGVLVAIAPVTEGLDQSCYRIWSGGGGARYAYLAGTSFSAPEVAGVAALVWAARPELENYQVADIIKQSARRTTGWTPTMGCGLLDAAAAVELAMDRSRTNVPRGNAVPCSAAAGAPSWPTDVEPPTVLAYPAFGTWGTPVSLAFKVSDDRGEVAARITVRKNDRTVARLNRDFFGIQSGQVYAFAWQTPSKKMTGALRFCVTITDRAGNKSTPSCAFISLR